MNLVNELSSEIAFTFLVEKKYANKVKLAEALSLIGKIKDALQPTLSIDKSKIAQSSAANVNGISH